MFPFLSLLHPFTADSALPPLSVSVCLQLSFNSSLFSSLGAPKGVQGSVGTPLAPTAQSVPACRARSSQPHGALWGHCNPPPAGNESQRAPRQGTACVSGRSVRLHSMGAPAGMPRGPVRSAKGCGSPPLVRRAVQVAGPASPLVILPLWSVVPSLREGDGRSSGWEMPGNLGLSSKPRPEKEQSWYLSCSAVVLRGRGHMEKHRLGSTVVPTQYRCSLNVVVFFWVHLLCCAQKVTSAK